MQEIAIETGLTDFLAGFYSCIGGTEIYDVVTILGSPFGIPLRNHGRHGISLLTIIRPISPTLHIIV